MLPDAENERWVSYTIEDLYPDWQARAHCAGVGVGYYFGEDDDQPIMGIRQVRAASKLCEVCPVWEDCLLHALTQREEYGVWAGTSGRVRRRIFKLVDNGSTTVAEVIEVFKRGEGDRYRLPYAREAQAHAGQRPERGEGEAGLRADARREAAL